MIQVLQEHWGTLLVLAALLAAVAVAVRSVHRRKKAGGSGCSCGCGDCPARGSCSTRR